jgi:flagellar biosynthesis/type III secretory pathway protein FliH
MRLQQHQIVLHGEQRTVTDRVQGQPAHMSYEELKEHLLTEARASRAAMLADARQTIAQMQAEAQAQADALIAQAHNDAETLRQDAEQQGYQAGYQQGHADGLQQSLNEAQGLVARLKADQHQLYQRMLPELATLMQHVCVQVCQHQFKATPQQWLALAHAATTQFTDQKQLTLVVPDALARLLAPLNTDPALQLMPDANLLPDQAFLLGHMQAVSLCVEDVVARLIAMAPLDDLDKA